MALNGITVVEVAGLAPAPFCGMILSDFGARVIRVDRNTFSVDQLSRGKESIAIDLRKDRGKHCFKELIKRADVVIEPFRPGVMERLGLGPDSLCALNPRLVYARLTGFGQSGALSPRAGHDINYIAIAGALGLFKRNGEAPLPPVNLLGDFAAGGMLCALGICIALLDRHRTGKGQVVDSAMVDGAAYLSSFVFGMRSSLWNKPPGNNMLDSAAPFYGIYQTKDNKYMAVGAIEPQFYAKLLQGLDLEQREDLPMQMDREKWDTLRAVFAERFLSKSQEEWSAIFDDSDACVTPVLSLDQLESNRHCVDRNLIVTDADGVKMPNAAPRLSRTPALVSGKKRPEAASDSLDILRELGYSEAETKQLIEEGAVKYMPKAKL